MARQKQITRQERRQDRRLAKLPAAARRALGLTTLGLWVEALLNAFWPALSVFAAGIAALMAGAGSLDRIGGLIGPLWLVLLAVFLLTGWRRLKPPAPQDAMIRVDASLSGRPLAALMDDIAIGSEDASSATLWAEYQKTATLGAAAARPVVTAPRLARIDPYGIRLISLTALAMALIFGDPHGLRQGWAGVPVRTSTASSNAPAWEGWAEPPAHTRKPVIYLGSLTADEGIELPQGSLVSLRLYGNSGFSQNIGPLLPEHPDDAPRFLAEQNGNIRLSRGPDIAVSVIPDQPPTISAGPAPERRADGRFIQRFEAQDDYAIASGEAVITLDLDKVPRRFGLAIAPEQRDALKLPLPLPQQGRSKIKQTINSDFSRHAFANLPVKLVLHASDGLGQTASTPPLEITLPGRRFFDPAAAALIELRQALLWNRDNAAGTAKILRAISWQPEGYYEPDIVIALRALINKLEAAPLDGKTRDDLAEIMWRTAVMLEDGGLGDALDRMKRAQRQLSEAIRQGATPDEIARLMRELREATDAYTKMLAGQGAAPEDRFTRSRPEQELGANQLQEMMNEIERLMLEGRTAEAQELLEQFNRLMENLSVRQSEGQGDGQGSGAGSRQGAIDGLTDTMRQQQQLADEAMRRPRGELGQWQPLGPGEADDLAEDQRDLRQQLGIQRGLLPGQGSEAGNNAGRDLDEAGRAMEEAENALRQGDTSGAMAHQAEAISRLREAMRQLSQSGAAQQGDADGESNRDGMGGSSPDGGSRDPLGRSMGDQGGASDNAGEWTGDEVQGPLARARDLLDEIRRRSGEMDRPKDERDYLGRLLDRF